MIESYIKNVEDEALREILELLLARIERLEDLLSDNLKTR